ncbi:MAG: anthranilate synthase component I family protein [Bacteroidota bacterium]
MRSSYIYKPENIDLFKTRVLHWAKNFNHVFFLNSNNYSKINKAGTSYHNFESVIATGCIEELFSNQNSFSKFGNLINYKDWLFGYLSYDLKNETENLTSSNYDGIKANNLHFICPEFVFIFSNTDVKIEHFCASPEKIIKDIEQIIPHEEKTNHIEIKNRISKHEYLDCVSKLKEHIQYGDIYEVNYCQEFYSEDKEVNPLQLYNKLNSLSPTPFSCFMRTNDIYLMSASPERFLKKTGNKIISQPIKGTIKRGNSPGEDLNLKNKLLNDEKERSENVMIVDLVRNDLSKTAKKDSVKVEELFGIYSFSQVHHIISTISSRVDSKYNITDIIESAFPMGSMTGAPKIRAMELIEKYEKTKRGIYSGSVGYITPEGDFDFNVVIRSIIYNSSRRYLSFSTGGAITSGSVPEKEYEECLLKADAMKRILKN